MAERTCENCSANTEFRIVGSTQGFFCTDCDWCVVTTWIPEIAQDVSEYQMFLLSADYGNKEQVKVLAKVANVNFLQARQMAQKEKPLIIQDKALVVDKARKLFDKLTIHYEIHPDFPY